MKEERYKELMEQVGMPALLLVLQQAVNETEQEVKLKLESGIIDIAPPEIGIRDSPHMKKLYNSIAPKLAKYDRELLTILVDSMSETVDLINSHYEKYINSLLYKLKLANKGSDTILAELLEIKSMLKEKQSEKR